MTCSVRVWDRLSGREAGTLVPGQDMDIGAWLRDLGLERHAQAFRDAEVTPQGP